MYITAIMPCSNNPTQVANALWLWERQTHKDKYLMLIDDYDNFNTQQGDDWFLYSSYLSYTGNYAEMYRFGINNAPYQTDAFVFWEGQNTYLPKYLELHANTLQTYDISNPDIVFMHGDYLSAQRTTKFIHSVIGFNSSIIDDIDSYVNTSTFSLTFINYLNNKTDSKSSPWSHDTVNNPYECQVVVGDPDDYFVHPSSIMTISPSDDIFQRSVLSYTTGLYRAVEASPIQSAYTALLLPEVQIKDFFGFESTWSGV